MAGQKRFQEKLLAAVRKLAVSEGDVRERLEGGYFHLRQLTEQEVPPRHREEFKAINEALTKLGPEFGSKGEIRQTASEHTLSRMRSSTACRIAARIFALANLK